MYSAITALVKRPGFDPYGFSKVPLLDMSNNRGSKGARVHADLIYGNDSKELMDWIDYVRVEVRRAMGGSFQYRVVNNNNYDFKRYYFGTCTSAVKYGGEGEFWTLIRRSDIEELFESGYMNVLVRDLIIADVSPFEEQLDAAGYYDLFRRMLQLMDQGYPIIATSERSPAMPF